MSNLQGRVSRRLDGALLSSQTAMSFEAASANTVSKPPRGAARAHGQAKIVLMEQVPAMLDWVMEFCREREAGRLVFALSYYAGLRVGEIAELTIRDLTDALGQIGNTVRVPAAIAKYNKARDIPMHPAIAQSLAAFRQANPDADQVALNSRGEPRSYNALTVWFHRVYKMMGLSDCSSHSGRRSFITYLANSHGQLGMSLRDVQLIAGHASLETTQAYIQPSSDLHRLIESVPWLPPLGPGSSPQFAAPPPLTMPQPIWGALPAWTGQSQSGRFA